MSKYSEYYDEWAVLYDSGKTLSEIARVYGSSKSTVGSALSRCGITLRSFHNEYRPEYLYFDDIDMSDKAYWMGFILADGCVQLSYKHRGLSIELSIRDIDHLRKFADIFNIDIHSRIRRKFGGDHQTCYITLWSTHLATQLNIKGIVPNKTYIQSDEVFENIPEYLMNHFILGYFDGDGGISTYMRGDRVCASVGFTGNNTHILQIRNILIDRCNINNVTIRYVNDVFGKVVWCGRNDIAAIYNYMYNNATLYLERKKRKFEDYVK